MGRSGLPAVRPAEHRPSVRWTSAELEIHNQLLHVNSNGSFSYIPAPGWSLRVPGLRDAARYAAVAAVYVVAAKIGFRAAFVAEQVSPVWPPSGLALWALLRFGISVAPAIWVGAFVANVTTHVPVLAAGGIAVGNTLEALMGAWLLRRLAGVDRSLDRLHQAVILVAAAAMLSTMAGATIGVAMLCAAALQPWSQFAPLWWTWWLGDATGDLLVAPLLLTWTMWTGVRNKAAPKAELAALLAVAIGVSLSAFTLRPAFPPGHRPLEYTVFPVVMWAALRFAHPGAALASMTVSSIAVWGTLHGTGPFGAGTGSPNERIILLQIYNAVLATSGLVFGAAIADRNHAERLRQTDHALTALLSQPLDLKEAAPRFLEAICGTLGWELGNLWQVDRDRQMLVYVDSWQRDRSTEAFVAASAAREFPSGVGLPGRVWARAQPAWIHDVVVDSNFPRLPIAARLGLHAGFAFPILSGSTVLGVMEFFTRVPRPVDDSLLTLMAAAGSQIGQFIDRSRTLQRVTESEALTSAVIDAALDCIITIDAKGTIIEFNPAAVRTFGFSREQVVGRELAEVIVPPVLREQHRHALRRSAETGETRILGRRLEMPAQRADGTELTVELAITRITIGPRPVFTAHLRDITERKRIEQEHNELLEREHTARLEAESANRTKDQFLATVSHELRTPLTAILGWASMLQAREFPPERLREIYDRIFRNAEAQARIVNDLLDVSRIVTGMLRLEWQEANLSEVARLSLDTIRPTATAKGLFLRSEIPDEACVVWGDPARLQQVIWNLLSNAAKFTGPGGTMTLRLRRTGPTVTIEVSDTGIGIHPSFLHRVFERFWQADSTSTRIHSGLGLGLALVRHIVEVHGGDVEARSAGEGCGSTFVIRLPARISNAATLAVADPAADGS
jgi:PAS domain S-box-containing protein